MQQNAEGLVTYEILTCRLDQCSHILQLSETKRILVLTCGRDRLG